MISFVLFIFLAGYYSNKDQETMAPFQKKRGLKLVLSFIEEKPNMRFLKGTGGVLGNSERRKLMMNDYLFKTYIVGVAVGLIYSIKGSLKLYLLKRTTKEPLRLLYQYL